LRAGELQRQRHGHGKNAEETEWGAETSFHSRLNFLANTIANERRTVPRREGMPRHFVREMSKAASGLPPLRYRLF